MKDYSNFHDLNTNERIIRNANKLVDISLNAYGSTEVVVNQTTTTRVLFSEKRDAEQNEKKVMGKPEHIQIGNYLNDGEFDWMITSFPERNEAYHKAEITVCNTTMKIVVGQVKTLVGRDSFGKPIYKYIDEEEVYPVVYTSKGYNIIDNSAISLPDDYIDVLIQYQPILLEKLEINNEYKFFNGTFKLTSIEHENVINEKGYLSLRMERQVTVT